MPVTTKAQLSAENGESVNSVEPRMCEFLSKTEKLSKSADNLKGLLFLPAATDMTFRIAMIGKSAGTGESRDRFTKQR
jgi:hypothetical protein